MAVRVAVPATNAVTTPDDDTVATDVAEEDQVTVRPVSTFPEASRRVAVAVVVRPAPRLGFPSDTMTVATGWLPTGDAEEPPHAEATTERRTATTGERRMRKLDSGVRWAR
jgi:hypothetical protein